MMLLRLRRAGGVSRPSPSSHCLTATTQKKTPTASPKNPDIIDFYAEKEALRELLPTPKEIA